MPKTEQRAFAAVRPGKNKPHVIPDTVRFYANQAREAAASYWEGGWPEAKRRGWRIRPVIIRVEDDIEGDSHDR